MGTGDGVKSRVRAEHRLPSPVAGSRSHTRKSVRCNGCGRSAVRVSTGAIVRTVCRIVVIDAGAALDHDRRTVDHYGPGPFDYHRGRGRLDHHGRLIRIRFRRRLVGCGRLVGRRWRRSVALSHVNPETDTYPSACAAGGMEQRATPVIIQTLQHNAIWNISPLT